MKTFRVCKTTELKEGQARAIKVLARQIAVFRVNDTIVAYDGLCKHMRAPLAVSGSIAGTVLTCAWHGWQYELRTGACIGKPGVELRTYPVIIEDDTIFVSIETPADPYASTN